MKEHFVAKEVDDLITKNIFYSNKLGSTSKACRIQLTFGILSIGIFLHVILSRLIVPCLEVMKRTFS